MDIKASAQIVKVSKELVPHKVEEALIYRLKQHAVRQCSSAAKAFAECSSGRALSVVWACRSQWNDLNTCVSQHTHADAQEQLKERWLAAGKPESPDWDVLLKGL
eukprot:jgi/Botrbrau1/21719/Bobra.43_1s0113.1